MQIPFSPQEKFFDSQALCFHSQENEKRKCVTNDLKDSWYKTVQIFSLKQETIILSLDNNVSDIMGCGMMPKKRGLQFDESPHLLESRQAVKRASITMALKRRRENYIYK